MLKRVLLLISLLVLTASSAWAMGRQVKTFPVTLSVDFGPAGKAAYRETIEVQKGMTPKDLVSQVFPIMTGKSCCSFREIYAIDGVKVSPDEKKWWICLLNGSKNVSPHRKKLKPNDLIEWKYIQT